MKIQPHTHRLVELECGGIVLQVEHFRFANKDAIHVSFNPMGVEIRERCGKEVLYEHGGHIVFTKDKEP